MVLADLCFPVALEHPYFQKDRAVQVDLEILADQQLDLEVLLVPLALVVLVNQAVQVVQLGQKDQQVLMILQDLKVLVLLVVLETLYLLEVQLVQMVLKDLPLLVDQYLPEVQWDPVVQMDLVGLAVQADLEVLILLKVQGAQVAQGDPKDLWRQLDH